MNIVAEMSLYPLRDGPIPTIIGFIRALRAQQGIEIVTNQLSSQVSGSFEAVTTAVNRCMEKVMASSDGTVVLVVKYLNVEKELDRPPTLTPDE
ncbi:MAG: hypothetical protein PVI83_02305 [Lysobacterales bacterium]|jgi:hypothetical protein